MDARFAAYELSRLGYFPTDPTDPNAVTYAKPSIILDELCRWASNMSSIENTVTTAVSKGNKRKNMFFADGYHDPATGDVMLVMWREGEHDSGRFFGLDRKVKPGKNNLETKEIDSTIYIPGSPSYFWYCASEGLLVNILTSHSTYSKSVFEVYIRSFLSNFHDKAQFINVKGSKKFSGIKIDGITRCDVSVEVEMKSKLVAGKRSLIIENMNKIKSIKKIEDVNEMSTEKRNTMLRMMDKVFDSVQSDQIVNTGRFITEFPWIATEQKIDRLLAEASTTYLQDKSILDIKLCTSETDISIFDNSVRRDFKLDVMRKDNEFVLAVNLFNAIEKQRELIVSELIK